MELDDALALTSDEGRALLASLPPYQEKDVVTLTARLRGVGHDPRLVAAALTQSRLRTRAQDKFGERAQHLLFTPDGLEQATRAAVAQHHATRFLDAGVTRVLDGGCGIGSDALGFATAGLDVVAIEADPATAVLARHNLAGHPDARVEIGSLDDLAPGLVAQDGTAWWFDPARRISGVADITGRTKRTFDLAALSPGWDLVRRLAGTTSAAGAKLSPSLPHAEIPHGCEAEFVSYAGDVVEATVWWGAAARVAGPTATIMRPPPHRATGDVATLHVTAAQAADADPTPAHRIGTHLYEADKALTRSGLVGALQHRVDGRELSPGYGYVTSDIVTDIGLFGRRYRIVDALPLQVKILRSHLRAAGVGRVTIKKRDIDLDADQLRRDLKLKGPGSAVLVLATVAGTRTALVVEPD